MNFDPFKFGLGPDQPAVTEKSDIWSAPLPAGRQAFGPSPETGDFNARVTYGDYFSAARRFLEHDHFDLLCRAVGELMGGPVDAGDVTGIGVFLMKHGAFYHPSCIKVQACGRTWHFVLNVAASSHGRKIIEREFQNLTRLHRQLHGPFWPRVFGQGCGRTDSGLDLPMFLGQWLEGFYEFHLTGAEDDDHTRVVVWDVDKGNRMLTDPQVREVLRQAAFILAYAYNPLTFEAICDWHHGAGDFVVNPDENPPAVRLITVRRYAPVIDLAEPDVAALLEALMFYLVDISLRLRLDRLDGTGKLACHSPDVIPDICRGFIQGLDSAAAGRGLPDDFGVTAKRWFALHREPDLMPLARSVVVKYPPDAEERPLLEAAIETHVSRLTAALRRL